VAHLAALEASLRRDPAALALERERATLAVLVERSVELLAQACAML